MAEQSVDVEFWRQPASNESPDLYQKLMNHHFKAYIYPPLKYVGKRSSVAMPWHLESTETGWKTILVKSLSLSISMFCLSFRYLFNQYLIFWSSLFLSKTICFTRTSIECFQGSVNISSYWSNLVFFGHVPRETIKNI